MLGLGLLPVAIAALGLLICARTAGGRCTAAACLLGVAAIVLLVWRRRAWRRAAVIAVGGVGCLSAAYALSPSAADVRATGLSVYLGDTDHARGALSNLVPEVDQFTFGSYLVPWADPFIDSAQAERIRGLFGAVYDGLAEDPRFARAGSTMNAAYAEIWRQDWRNDHLYRYPPEGAGPARPVLLFMHGSGGNFLGYLWVLKRFADAQGWAVVAPDFGFGNWAWSDPRPVLAQTLAYIDARPELDGRRIILAGLSNGGLGVARALTHAPERFESVVLFSAVTRLIDRGAPTTLPWYILHGSADRRIPMRFIDATVEKLRRGGARVHRVIRPTDHFLFFDDHAAVDAILAAAAERRAPTDRP